MAGSEAFLSNSWYRVAGLRPRLSDQASVRLHRYRGKPWYVLDDAAAGQVHRLSPAALGIIAAMDGRTTLDDIWHAAARRLGEEAPTQEQVLQLLGQLHANDMLRADVVPDTQELLGRAAQERQRRLKGLLNPLSLRFGLFNPDRFLRRTMPLFAPLFSVPGLLAWFVLVGIGLVIAGQNWTALTTDVGDRILATDNLLLLAVCLPLTKALHELGHGYACRRFGAPVPQTGIMFMMLLPMPYVDASAAAALRSRMRRVIVGAAGMMVELAVASIALLVWVAVEPGLLRSIAFNVVVTASITTVLFNGNPLMRYDGYYILADLIEMPNLGQRATRFWGHLVNRYLFCLPGVDDHGGTVVERAWLLFYAPLSLVYRLTVTFGIAFFLAEHYWAVGVALAAWSLGAAVLRPLGKAAWHVLAAPALQSVRARAIGVTIGGAGALAACALMVPAPHHTIADGVVWLPETAMLRAGTDGFVDRILAAPGQSVDRAAAIVQSAEPALLAKRDGLAGRVAELRAQFQSEQFQKLVDAQVTETELTMAETELAEANRRVDRLVARSGSTGILAIPRAPDLPGRFLREGELIGYVLPPEGSRVVRTVVSQDDIDLVRNHLSRIELQIAGHPETTFVSRVLREVPSARDSISSKALGTAGGGTAPVDPRDPKGMRTLRRTFEVDIDLPPGAPGDAYGARVHVRLDHQWEPVGEQLYRRVRQSLLSRLHA